MFGDPGQYWVNECLDTVHGLELQEMTSDNSVFTLIPLFVCVMLRSGSGKPST